MHETVCKGEKVQANNSLQYGTWLRADPLRRGWSIDSSDEKNQRDPQPEFTFNQSVGRLMIEKYGEERIAKEDIFSKTKSGRKNASKDTVECYKKKGNDKLVENRETQ